MKIVSVTNNKNKLQEAHDILGEWFEIVSLQDIGCHKNTPETGDTLQENTLQEAVYVAKYYRLDCFADDMDLEVNALDGKPDVHSARYVGGTDHDSETNMRKLSCELQGKNSQKIHFRVVIVLLQHPKDQQEKNIDDAYATPEIYYFEGRVGGLTVEEKRDEAGFGYDLLFVPNRYNQSLAGLGEDIKNHISHHALAVKKLAAHLNEDVAQSV